MGRILGRLEAEGPLLVDPHLPSVDWILFVAPAARCGEIAAPGLHPGVDANRRPAIPELTEELTRSFAVRSGGWLTPCAMWGLDRCAPRILVEES